MTRTFGPGAVQIVKFEALEPDEEAEPRGAGVHAAVGRNELEDMCHELRTPINAVVGYVALLDERVYGDLNSEQGEAVERIRFAAEHLVVALRHLFEMADLDLGEFHVAASSSRRSTGHVLNSRTAATKTPSGDSVSR